MRLKVYVEANEGGDMAVFLVGSALHAAGIDFTLHKITATEPSNKEQS